MQIGEVSEIEQRYIDQEDSTVMVTFRLPRHDWDFLKTTSEWQRIEKYLRAIQT